MKNLAGIVIATLSAMVMVNGQTRVCPTPTTTVLSCNGCTGRPTSTVTSTVYPITTYYPPCPTLIAVEKRDEDIERRQTPHPDPVPGCTPTPDPTVTLPCRLCTAVPTTTTVTTTVPITRTVLGHRICPLE